MRSSASPAAAAMAAAAAPGCSPSQRTPDAIGVTVLKPGKKVTVCWDGARLPTLDNGCPSCRRGAACRLVCSSAPRGLSPPHPQPRFSAQDQAKKLLIVEDSWRNSGPQLAPRLDDATSQPLVPRSGVFGPISAATVLRWPLLESVLVWRLLLCPTPARFFHTIPKFLTVRAGL